MVGVNFIRAIEFYFDRIKIILLKQKMSQVENALLHFDAIEGTDGMYTCKICRKPRSGKKKTNLLQHLFSLHKVEYNQCVSSQITPEAAKTMQLKLLQCMVEKVTVNGRPFASLNDSGYIKSIEDKLDLLTKAGFGINLCDKKYTLIKKLIAETTNKIIEIIKGETKGQRISLMLDIATKNHTSVLGINIRYIIDDAIVERCIGMLPLAERHTSKNLAIELKKCLEKFEITLKQMKSITTDNASNVVGIVDYLADDMLCTIEEEEEEGKQTEEEDDLLSCAEETEANRTADDCVSEEEIQAMAQHILDEEALNEYLDDRDEYDELLKKVIEDLPHHFNENTFSVRCGAHVLNLVVRGALKMSNIHGIVTVCRKVAKLLRQEASVRIARKHNLKYKKPKLNVDTRWDSDCIMVIVLCFAYYICSFVSFVC